MQTSIRTIALCAYSILLPVSASASCATLGLPGDGDYDTWFSTIYRANGNTVSAYSSTSVYGPDAGLLVTRAKSYTYLNGALMNQYEADSNVYGATVTAYTNAVLHGVGYPDMVGTFNFGNPAALENVHWVDTPYCESLGYIYTPYYYFDYASPLTVAKPTVTANLPVFWYLNGAPSIDGYFVQDYLYGHANWGSNVQLHWAVTQNGKGKISLPGTTSNDGAPFLATSTAASGVGPGNTLMYDIQVSVDTDGYPGIPLSLCVDAPIFLFQTPLPKIVNPGGLLGYENLYQYSVLDSVGNSLVKITTHETLENYKSQDASSNWAAIGGPGLDAQVGTWYPQVWTNSYSFTDTLEAFCPGMPCGWSPLPNSGGSSGKFNLTQKFFVGTPGPANPKPVGVPQVFTGTCVGQLVMEYYTDHADKPVILSPPTNQANCRAGAYINY